MIDFNGKRTTHIIEMCDVQLFSAVHVRVMLRCSCSFHCARFSWRKRNMVIIFVRECNMKVWFRIEQIQNAWKSILRIVVLVIQPPHVYSIPFSIRMVIMMWWQSNSSKIKKQNERRQRRGDDEEDIFLFIDFFVERMRKHTHQCKEKEAKNRRQKQNASGNQ